MKRFRLLLVLFTALVLAFTGVATASAASAAPHEDDPEIISVSDVWAKGKHPHAVVVQIKYVCDGKRDKGTLEVRLRQQAYDSNGGWKHGKARYEATVRADCDGDKHRQWVKLWKVERDNGKKSGYVHNGNAHVDVTLSERHGDEVSDTFKVEVKGAGHHRKH